MRRGEVEVKGGGVDFMSERLPQCPRGIMVISVFSRKNTCEMGEMEGEMLSASCCHLSNEVTHYVLF